MINIEKVTIYIDFFFFYKIRKSSFHLLYYTEAKLRKEKGVSI